jgi:hypothetical protein
MRRSAIGVAVIVGVLAASGCGSGAKETAHYTTSPPTASGPKPAPVALTRFRQEVQIARASNRRLFSIFPAAPGKRRCSIPEGGPLPSPPNGTCQTSVRPRSTMEPSWTVTFTERWRRPICTPALAVGCLRPWRHHTWQITEGETIVTQGTKPHIYSTRSRGATPPQDYK